MSPLLSAKRTGGATSGNTLVGWGRKAMMESNGTVGLVFRFTETNQYLTKMRRCFTENRESADRLRRLFLADTGERPGHRLAGRKRGLLQQLALENRATLFYIIFYMNRPRQPDNHTLPSPPQVSIVEVHKKILLGIFYIAYLV